MSHKNYPIPHALGIKALLRHRRSPLHHVQLLSPSETPEHSRAPRSSTQSNRTDANPIPIRSSRLRGHARTHAPIDLRTANFESLNGNAGNKVGRSKKGAPLLPGFGRSGDFDSTLLDETFLRLQPLEPAERVRKTPLHAPEPSRARIGSPSRRLAMEQFSFLCLQRRRPSSNQRLVVVGRKDQSQSFVRTKKNPHFSRKHAREMGHPSNSTTMRALGIP